MPTLSEAATVRTTLGAITIAVLGARLWLADQVVAPFLFHDEGAYVATGRALVGGSPELFGSRYAPGYGLLLSPAVAVLDPGGVHLAAKVVNAVALALLIPVGYLLARRVAGLDRWLSLGAAVAGSAAAGLTVQATMLLPEAVLVLATTSTVLLLSRWSASPTVSRAVACGACAGTTYVLHPRGAATVVAVVVAATLAAVLRQVPVARGVLLAGSALVVAGAGHLFGAWAVDRLYPLPAGGKGAGDLARLLEDPVGIARVGVGHVWYLLVTTGGLAALGLVTAARLAWRDRRAPVGAAAACIVVGFASAVVLSALVHEGVSVGLVDRPDKIVYGRYLQQWSPALVVLAPAIVRAWSRRAATVSVLVAAATSALVGALLHVAYDPDVWSGPVAWHNVAALWLVQDWFGRLWVVRTALVASVALVVLLLPAARRDSHGTWALPLGAVLVAGALAGHGVVAGWAAPASRSWSQSRQLGPVVEELDLPVAVDAAGATALFHALNLQLWYPDVDIDLAFKGIPGTPALQISALAAGAPTPGAVLVAIEPRLDLGLWAVDPDVVERLREDGRRFLEPTTTAGG